MIMLVLKSIYEKRKGWIFMEYVGTKEAAEMLGWAQNTVAKKCREGFFLRAEQDAKGSPWRIPKVDVEELLAERNK